MYMSRREQKSWSWISRRVKPEMSVLVKTSSNLTDQPTKAVATVFQRIMTELNGTKSEEKIVAITKIVLKLVQQNCHALPTTTMTNDRLILSSERAPHIDCLTVIKI
jgi:hypothetical protein